MGDLPALVTSDSICLFPGPRRPRLAESRHWQVQVVWPRRCALSGRACPLSTPTFLTVLAAVANSSGPQPTRPASAEDCQRSRPLVYNFVGPASYPPECPKIGANLKGVQNMTAALVQGILNRYLQKYLKNVTTGLLSLNERDCGSLSPN